MATIDTTSAAGASAQQALLQRPQNPSDQSAGSDNRTVGAGQQAPVNSATAAAQRPTIADTDRSQEGGQDRTEESRSQGFDQAVRVDIRSAQGQQAANANESPEPAGGRQEQNGVPINFSQGGSINTSSNPNQAGRNLSLSV
jgi:hypothetical protein